MWRTGAVILVNIIAFLTLTGFIVSEDDGYIAPLYSRSVQLYGKYIVKLTEELDVDNSILEIGDILKTKSTAGTYKINRVFKHAIKAFTADLHQEDLDTLRRNRMVEYVEEDLPVTHFTTVDEITWGLDRIDQRNINLDNKYEVNGNGSNVNVYVIDTGILTSHEEFGDRAHVAFDALDGNGADCSGHGTHCAGIIGGKKYGVAKGVNLFGIRTMDCSGTGTSSEVIEAFEWIRQHGELPAIASISLGTDDGEIVLSLDRAVEKVIDMGVTVVAAAGNSATDACRTSPARGEKVITVGATGEGDLLASFSNIGPCVDILAPGVNIISTWFTDEEPVRTLSGTSMACPHVTGAAAILLGQNPDLTPEQIKRILLENATTNAISITNNACTNTFLYVP
ncbi:aqualysin-1-like [Amphiura filiformis]|uniref:aqualysin-1-like n=1 Tax=Amphiura filiformis TaxID=82378 RepID=UPI003B21DA22